MTHDIVIVGAGPVGLFLQSSSRPRSCWNASWNPAARCRDVTVIDRRLEHGAVQILTAVMHPGAGAYLKTYLV